MHKINDNIARSFIDISTTYPQSYIVVEVADAQNGEEWGRVVFLCDTFDEAWEAGTQETQKQTIILEGIDRMNTMGVVL